MRTAGVSVDDVKEIVPSGSLGHGWSIPNSWDRGENEEENKLQHG